MAGVFSNIVGVAAFSGWRTPGKRQLIILFMGAFTIGLGIALVTTGTGYPRCRSQFAGAGKRSWPTMAVGVFRQALSKLKLLAGPSLPAVMAMTCQPETSHQDSALATTSPIGQHHVTNKI